jgi:hypothetical protein
VKGTWQTTSSGPGGGLIVAIIVVLIVAGSGAASAIASAIVTILIIAAAVIALAVIGGIAVLVYRARSDRPRRPIALTAMVRNPPERARNWRVPTNQPPSRPARSATRSRP